MSGTDVLADLKAQRDVLAEKIRQIDSEYEGGEKEENIKRIQELDAKQTQLIKQRSMIQSQLDNIANELSEINTKGKSHILEAIKNQRWFFFKNKTKVVMDKYSGLLWANPNYFQYAQSKNNKHNRSDTQNMLNKIQFDGMNGWKLPTMSEFRYFLDSCPFRRYDKYYITSDHAEIWWCQDGFVDLKWFNEHPENWSREGYTLPCNNTLIADTDYEKDIAQNFVYTEEEKLQLTLNLFVKNKLLPVFKSEEVTQLYKKIYFEKPDLMEKLQLIQHQIDEMEIEESVKKAQVLLSADFDYTILLEKYNVSLIDRSVIKYYEAVQRWTTELLDKLDAYERSHAKIIGDFTSISLKMGIAYNENHNLTESENALLADRQNYFRDKFSLGMATVKSKLIAVKEQADAIEKRIDKIDDGKDAIRELALLEEEKRASFALVAENTAKIVKRLLKKIDYFQTHHEFVLYAIDIENQWSEDYQVFKTTYKENLRIACEEDSIEAEDWKKWYEDWQNLRFAIEKQLQPFMDYALVHDMESTRQEEKSIPECVIQALEEYKHDVDRFFKEERKGIYQKFVFQIGGALQEKFEVESSLYKATAAFQERLQGIIFRCTKGADREFILKWADKLLDLQITEILDFVAEEDLQQISEDVLTEFAALRQKNYDIYLADARAYGKEQLRRDKEYNSLIFKMRKDLTKK